MGRLLNVITMLHKKTQRDYVGRMTDNKVECMKIAKRYGKDYWDGDRRHGYGGFKYDGRWEAVARRLIDIYKLPDDAKILDVGCGKGFLLYEFTKLLPKAQVVGFDISEYAIENAKEEVRDRLFVYKAQDPYPYGDKEFDLVYSINTIHNLHVYEVLSALQEIERVGKNKFVEVEGYRNEEELFNLQCWVLTGECFLKPQEWIWMFNEFGYHGDYEFIYFE
jgi:SAM-dependent methyltransferase